MDFLSELISISGKDNVRTDERMDKHTTFRAGGPAKFMVLPASSMEIADVLRLCHKENMPYYVVGNGSNLLVSDEGYKGIIILLGSQFSDITIEGDVITAKAGALLSKIGQQALENELTGFEFASGIPGSTGGACVMNAGAYGGEIKDILISVKVIGPDFIEREYLAEELDLGYRHSRLMDGNYVVTEAVFKLKKGDGAGIKNTMDDLAERRRDKQPLNYPSAGSTFKRPEGYFAGKLIEDSGLKGKGVGDACVSEKHAGFVINKGGASASDIAATIKMVENTVWETQGVKLEPEVKLLGFFKDFS